VSQPPLPSEAAVPGVANKAPPVTQDGKSAVAPWARRELTYLLASGAPAGGGRESALAVGELAAKGAPAVVELPAVIEQPAEGAGAVGPELALGPALAVGELAAKGAPAVVELPAEARPRWTDQQTARARANKLRALAEGKAAAPGARNNLSKFDAVRWLVRVIPNGVDRSGRGCIVATAAVFRPKLCIPTLCAVVSRA